MQCKLVLLNREGALAACGDTFMQLAESLQNKGLVNIDVDGRFWKWKNPPRTLEYAKKEDEERPNSGFTREVFYEEASYDIVLHACKKLGYNLYRLDVYF